MGSILCAATRAQVVAEQLNFFVTEDADLIPARNILSELYMLYNFVGLAQKRIPGFASLTKLTHRDRDKIAARQRQVVQCTKGRLAPAGASILSVLG